MTIQMNQNLAIRTGLALAMTLATWSPALSQTTEPAKPKKMMMDGKKMEHSQMMQDHWKEMMTEMKAQDAELTTQVAAMNSAPKESKVDLLAAIVTKLVEQRTAMNARMENMHGEMMKHMQMGKDAKPQHPMMKGMDKKSDEMHKE